MKYMGSKARIAPEIMPLILEGRKEGQYYVEPFCGGCNSLACADGKRIGSDLNQYLIAMWKGLQAGVERPRIITKEMYDAARMDFRSGRNDHYDDFMIGWIGFMSSFNGKFFQGYTGNTKVNRDYIRESINNVESQIARLQDVAFFNCGYEELAIPDESIIYCDIPYRDTSGYTATEKFDHDRFWSWCTLQKKGTSDLC